MYRRIAERACALLVPPRCVACQRASDPGRRLCVNCRAELLALPAGGGDDRSFAAFAYRGAAQRAVGALKFRHAPAVAAELAELMRPRLPAWAPSADWIVPVPAHPSRLRARGYNQSLALARAIAGPSGARVVDCLRRAPLSPPQSELSRADRLALPSGAFRVDERVLRRTGGGRLPPALVLCDDVVTTGVTLERCAQALGEWQAGRGACEIRSVAFARAGAGPRS